MRSVKSRIHYEFFYGLSYLLLIMHRFRLRCIEGVEKDEQKSEEHF